MRQPRHLPLVRYLLLDFLIQSHIDNSVLQPMPLGKLIENKEDSVIPLNHEGHAVLPGNVPRLVSRSYVPVVVMTIVRNGKLQIDYFSIPEDRVPRSIYMTIQGKARTYMHFLCSPCHRES